MSWSLAGIVRPRARDPRPMIVCGSRTVTWVEMDERSSRMAQGLRAAGLQPQDRVAFLDKNGVEYFDVLFGGARPTS